MYSSAMEIVLEFNGLMHEDVNRAIQVLHQLQQDMHAYKFNSVRLLDMDAVLSTKDEMEVLSNIVSPAPIEEEVNFDDGCEVAINSRTLRLLYNKRCNSGYGNICHNDRHHKLNKRNFREKNWTKRNLDLDASYYGYYAR